MNVEPAELPGLAAATSLALLRQHAPLVHCLTNDVVQAFTANTLLAVGAAPAMVIEPREAAQFSAVADALLINIGTLTERRGVSMLAAIEAANQAGTPWVLDPVAVGALTFRTEFALSVLPLKPAAIRANASEILALAGQPALGRGVDSADDSRHALPFARRLAEEYGTLVAVTGRVDFITDGERAWSVADGDIMMTRVTGTGCALSAVVAAFCALPGDRLQHVAAACRVMARAGRLTAPESAGPGSFAVGLLDRLYRLQGEDLQ
ncbi:hydroxyethylthiazole kinase [Acerihabitans arboris]|uniref:Hydroxyethylthiazole kinase n=1 Tax=Acerihabitans arboris TaxID=2691583 RepID=A0A845SJH5_9GAMM|nr:hydroxyethylthiazole kinase [Acerihabitans arboris]NDL65363.1 hydroxyethylthiazole kinase [Acerihabitans arboris]